MLAVSSGFSKLHNNPLGSLLDVVLEPRLGKYQLIEDEHAVDLNFRQMECVDYIKLGLVIFTVALVFAMYIAVVWFVYNYTS